MQLTRITDWKLLQKSAKNFGVMILMIKIGKPGKGAEIPTESISIALNIPQRPVGLAETLDLVHNIQVI